MRETIMALEPKEQKLINAVNLVVERLENLPPGYTYKLTAWRDDANADLIDPDGNEIHVDAEANESHITAMIRAAHDHYHKVNRP
jgi:ubiquinone biosynthesis protein Coq4